MVCPLSLVEQTLDFPRKAEEGMGEAGVPLFPALEPGGHLCRHQAGSGKAALRPHLAAGRGGGAPASLPLPRSLPGLRDSLLLHPLCQLVLCQPL